MNDELTKRFLSQGALKAGDLTRMLGVNQSTLSRRASKIADLIRFGHTNRSQYALRREILPLGFEEGLYRVAENAKLAPIGAVNFLMANQSVLMPQGELYDGLHPMLYDLMPDGFLGRAFAQKYSLELGFPNQLRDWTKEQKLVSIAKRGEDLIGNVIFGTESASRWQQHEPFKAEIEDLPTLAKQAHMGQPLGSSVGGEQPKLCVFIEGSHYIVKFAGSDDSAFSRRWKELLKCEDRALSVLARSGIKVANTKILEISGYTFLLSERFDRNEYKGRRGIVSLSAVDNHFYGKLQRWSMTGELLCHEKRVSKETLRQIKLVEAYAMLIADSDRHFHNLSLIPSNDFEKFELAPIYDKLPMFFAPQNHLVIEREYIAPVPLPNLIEVWGEAKDLADEFWKETEFRTFH